jgi:hypothetical protein
MPGFQDFANATSAAIAVVAALYAARQARIQHRREDFELARALHADLTTGLVAQARNLLGSVAFVKAGAGTDADEVRGAYFTLLWCFERIEGGRRALTHRRPPNPAVVFLDDMIRWHVEFWTEGFEDVRRWIAEQPGGPVRDDSSRTAFDRLSAAFLTQPGQNP